MATCEEESSASFESHNAIIMDADNDVEVIKVMVNGDVSVHGDGDECRRTYVVVEEDGVVEQVEKLELQSNCSNGSKIEEEKREESIERNDDNDVADIKVTVNGDVSGQGDGDECRTYVVVEEDGVVEQRLERLELQSNCSNGSKIVQEKREEHVECNDDNDVADNESKSRVYSLRPYVVDCTYYTKTGSCKFGKNCRYNHPLWRAFKPGGDKEKTCEESIESVDDAAKIECKYYQTAGWCKYGDACRYNHSARKIEKEYLQLNFLGLPIRPTAQECAYYLQHGSCAYGANCRFNHPEPSAVNEYDKSGDSLGNDNFEESGVNSSRNCRGVSLQSFGGLQQHASMSHNDINLRNGSNDMMSSYHQRLPQTPETDPSQVISPSANEFLLPHQRVSGISERVAPVSHDENPIEFDEFPVRPGQPDCNFFMKTGYCKFRSACRYNHPSSQISKQSKPPPILPSQLLNGTYSTRHKNQQMHCALSEQGLPLRPGAKLCRNYEQHGMCRYGRNCLFNHPDDLSPYV